MASRRRQAIQRNLAELLTKFPGPAVARVSGSMAASLRDELNRAMNRHERYWKERGE